METQLINPEDDPKEIKRQRHRVHMSRMAVVNTMIQSGMLALFSMTGAIPAWVALAFFFINMVTTGAFYLLFKSGKNLKLHDKGLLIPQMVVNGCIQFVFIFLAPKLAILFLLVLIVVFSYGLIQFTPRQFTLSWLIYGAVTGLALWLIRDRFGYPGVANIDIALIWLFFFLAMREHTFFGAKFNRLRNQVAEKNEQLQVLLAKIEKLASHDSLTGALNRRCLIEKLEAELQRAARTGHTFCFAMIDLDYFKDVNDKYGHPTGDAVLKIVAECVDRSLRTPDQFGRLGGEEFGIILPSTEPSQGMVAIERIRDVVAQYDWEKIAPDLTITFSAGISANADGDTVDVISRRVDKALYQAKHQGRNCIVPVEFSLPATPQAVMSQSDDTSDPPDIYQGF